jgi:sporulation protein YunB
VKKKAFVLLLILSVCIFALYLFSSRLESEVRVFVATEGKTRLSSKLHAAIDQRLSEMDEEFITISRNASDRVTSVQLHTKQMGLFAENLSLFLFDVIANYNDDEYGVPLGNLTNLVFLSGKGPVIPVEPIVVGGIANELKSDFISSGINQTLYRVTLTYSIAVRYLSPIQDVYDSITIRVVLVEALIVGDVPIYRD